MYVLFHFHPCRLNYFTIFFAHICVRVYMCVCARVRVCVHIRETSTRFTSGKTNNSRKYTTISLSEGSTNRRTRESVSTAE